MYFKGKAYDKLLEWKENYADKYAVLLEGARRVANLQIAEHFAKNLISMSTSPPSFLMKFSYILKHARPLNSL